MIIIETCPKCGHDLHYEIICTYPPIPRKVCYSCGWSWEDQREEVIRVPFGGNLWNEQKEYTLLNGTLENAITNNFGFGKTTCISCPSNPKNGGDGICFCTLGQMNVVY